MKKKSLAFHLLLFATILYISSGCNDQFYGSGDQQSTHVAEVSTIYQVEPEEASEANLSDLVSEVEYTFIELPDDNYLREVSKVIFHRDDVFIFDRAIQSTEARVFCFDSSGAFKYVIDRVGRGPGEYVHLMDFSVDRNHVIIYDQTKLLYYNRDNGEFDKSIKLNSFVSFATLDENTVVVDGSRTTHNENNNQLLIYNTAEKEVLYEGVPFNNRALMMEHIHRRFFHAGDSLSAIPMYSQIVYRVTIEEGDYAFEPAYELDFGDSWIPNQLLANSYRNRDRFFSSYTEFVHTPEVFETKDMIYTFYKLHKEDHVFIHDRRSGESKNIKGFTDNQIGWIGKPLTTDGDWIVNMVTPYQIEDAGITPGNELQSILNQTNDIGQPILVKAKFKVE